MSSLSHALDVLEWINSGARWLQADSSLHMGAYAMNSGSHSTRHTPSAELSRACDRMTKIRGGVPLFLGDPGWWRCWRR